MSSAGSLKCSHTNCDFETFDQVVLDAHLIQFDAAGTRWVCQGLKCGKMFCTTEALDSDGGHFDSCKKFQTWAAKRKYGKKLNGRVKEMCKRSPEQLTGAVAIGPTPRYADGSMKRHKETESDEKVTSKRLKATLTPSIKALGKSASEPAGCSAQINTLDTGAEEPTTSPPLPSERPAITYDFRALSADKDKNNSDFESREAGIDSEAQHAATNPDVNENEIMGAFEQFTQDMEYESAFKDWPSYDSEAFDWCVNWDGAGS